MFFRVMLAAVRSPRDYKGFIDFLIIGNTLHALVMTVSAQQPLHFIDAAVVGLMGLLPLSLYPWKLKTFLRPITSGGNTSNY